MNGWCLNAEWWFCRFDEDGDHLLTCDEFNELFTYAANFEEYYYWIELVTPGVCWPDIGESICRLFSEIDLN